MEPWPQGLLGRDRWKESFQREEGGQISMERGLGGDIWHVEVLQRQWDG